MNGKFCGFSPCIEQVQRTAEALRQAEFCDVRCIECILRYHDVRTENYALPVNACSSPPVAAPKGPADTSAHKRTAAEAGIDPEDPVAAVNADAVDAGAGPSRGSGQDGAKAVSEKKSEVKEGRVKERRLGRHRPPYVPWMSEHESVRRTVTMPRHVARGHTGYLLFARKPVKVADSSGSDAGKDVSTREPAQCEDETDAVKQQQES